MINDKLKIKNGKNQKSKAREKSQTPAPKPSESLYKKILALLKKHKWIIILVLFAKISQEIIKIIQPVPIKLFDRHILSLIYEQTPVFDILKKPEWIVYSYFLAVIFFAAIFLFKFRKSRYSKTLYIFLFSGIFLLLLNIVTGFKLLHIFRIQWLVPVDTNFSDIYFDIFILILLWQYFTGTAIFRCLSKWGRKYLPLAFGYLNYGLPFLIIPMLVFLFIAYVTRSLFVLEPQKKFIITLVSGFLFSLPPLIWKTVRNKKEKEKKKKKRMEEKEIEGRLAEMIDKHRRSPAVTIALAVCLYFLVSMAKSNLDSSYHTHLKQVLEVGNFAEDYLLIDSKESPRLFRKRNPIYKDFEAGKTPYIIASKFQELEEHIDKKPIIVELSPEIHTDLAARELSYKLMKSGRTTFIVSYSDISEMKRKKTIARILKHTGTVLLVNDSHLNREDRTRLLNYIDRRIICIEQSAYLPKFVQEKLEQNSRNSAGNSGIEKDTGESIFKLSLVDNSYERGELLRIFEEHKAAACGKSDTRYFFSPEVRKTLMSYPFMRLYLFLNYFYYDDSVCIVNHVDKLKRVIREKLRESLLETENIDKGMLQSYYDVLYMISIFNRYNLFPRRSFLEKNLGPQLIENVLQDRRIIKFVKNNLEYITFYNIEEAKLLHDFIAKNPDYGVSIKKKLSRSDINLLIDTRAHMKLFQQYMTMYPEEINEVLPALLEIPAVREWLADNDDYLYHWADKGIFTPSRFPKQAMLSYMIYLEPDRLMKQWDKKSKNQTFASSVLRLLEKPADFYYYVAFLQWLDPGCASTVIDQTVPLQRWRKTFTSLHHNEKMKYLEMLKDNHYQHLLEVYEYLRDFADEIQEEFQDRNTYFRYLKEIGFSFESVPPEQLAKQFEIHNINDIYDLVNNVESLGYRRLGELQEALMKKFEPIARQPGMKLEDVIVVNHYHFKSRLNLEENVCLSLLKNVDSRRMLWLLGNSNENNIGFYNALKRLPPEILLKMPRESPLIHYPFVVIRLLAVLDNMGYPHMADIIDDCDFIEAHLQDDFRSEIKEAGTIVELLKKYNPSRYEKLRLNCLGSPTPRSVAAFSFTPGDFIDYHSEVSDSEQLRNLEKLYDIKYNGLQVLLRNLSMTGLINRFSSQITDPDHQEIMIKLLTLYTPGPGKPGNLPGQVKAFVENYTAYTLDTIKKQGRLLDQDYKRLRLIKQLHPPSFSKAAAFLEKEKIIENIIKGFRFLDAIDPNDVLWAFLRELDPKYVKKILNSIELDVFVDVEGNNNRRLEALAGWLNYFGCEDVHFFSLHWLETTRNAPLIYYMFNHLRLGLPVEDIRRLEFSGIFSRMKDTTLDRFTFLLHFLWKTGYFEITPLKEGNRVERLLDDIRIKNLLLDRSGVEGSDYEKRLGYFLRVLNKISPASHSRLLETLKVHPLKGRDFYSDFYHYPWSAFMGFILGYALETDAALTGRDIVIIRDLFFQGGSQNFVRILEKANCLNIDLKKMLPEPAKIEFHLNHGNLSGRAVRSLFETLGKLKYQYLENYILAFNPGILMEAARRESPLEMAALVHTMDNLNYPHMEALFSYLEEKDVIEMINSPYHFKVKLIKILVRYYHSLPSILLKINTPTMVNNLYRTKQDHSLLLELRKLNYPIASLFPSKDYSGLNLILGELKSIQKLPEFPVILKRIDKKFNKEFLVDLFFKVEGAYLLRDFHAIGIPALKEITVDELYARWQRQGYDISELAYLLAGMNQIQKLELSRLKKLMDFSLIAALLRNSSADVRYNFFKALLRFAPGWREDFFKMINPYLLIDTIVERRWVRVPTRGDNIRGSNFQEIDDYQTIFEQVISKEKNPEGVRRHLVRVMTDTGKTPGINSLSFLTLLKFYKQLKSPGKRDLIGSIPPGLIFQIMHSQNIIRDTGGSDAESFWEPDFIYIKQILYLLEELSYPHMTELLNIFSRQYLEYEMKALPTNRERKKFRELISKYPGPNR